MSTERLEALKRKYKSALDLLAQLGIKLQNLHVQDNKLFIKGHAQYERDSHKVWDEIKRVEKNYAADLLAQFTFDVPVSKDPRPVNPAPVQAQAAADEPEEAEEADPRAGARTHTIKSGDTLSALAKRYYGNAKLYMKIFEANRDKMPDPNRGLHPGDVIVIPALDD